MHFSSSAGEHFSINVDTENADESISGEDFMFVVFSEESKKT